jgi:hypothetical protein
MLTEITAVRTKDALIHVLSATVYMKKPHTTRTPTSSSHVGLVVGLKEHSSKQLPMTFSFL